jgi:hypothetical protein
MSPFPSRMYPQLNDNDARWCVWPVSPCAASSRDGLSGSQPLGTTAMAALNSMSLPFGSWTAIRLLPALRWALKKQSVRPEHARNAS